MTILLRKQHESAPNRNEHPESAHILLPSLQRSYYKHSHALLTHQTRINHIVISPSTQKAPYLQQAFPLTFVASFAMPFSLLLQYVQHSISPFVFPTLNSVSLPAK